MFLKGKKEEEKNNKLIEWGYTKLTNKTFCVYIINYCNMDTLKKKVEEINNAKVIPKISLDINYYMEFYISNRDFKRDFKDGIEEYLFTLCLLDEDKPISEEVDILNEYDFKKFVEMVDLINDTTTILKEEILVNDNVNDIINKPNHYQLFVKDKVIEVIDIIDSIVQNYTPKQAVRVANIIKYILRADKKNGLEDFKKAKKYIEMLLEME